MKSIYVIISLWILFCCQSNKKGNVAVKLRITQCTDKRTKKDALLLTTILENRTNQDIFFIKGFPLSSIFQRQFGSVSKNLDQELNFHSEMESNCFNGSINLGNYFERVIAPFPMKNNVLDSLSKLNASEIKSHYGNYFYKFKSQFVVMNRGESLEIDNILIHGEDREIIKYKLNEKSINSLTERKKIGENLIVPSQIGDYYFWDGKMIVDVKEIDFYFKEL